MNKKILLVVVAIVALLIVGVTAFTKNDDEKDAKQETKQEKKQEVKQESEIVQNEELTKQLNDTEGVKEGKVYEQDNVVTGTFEVAETVSDEDAKVMVEKYIEVIKKAYSNSNKKVNVIATKNGKTVAEINKVIPFTGKDIETVTVKSLVDKGIITFKENPVSQQMSLLLDSEKLTGDLKGKKPSAIQLLIAEESFAFQTNRFKLTQFEVANTDYTVEQLTAGKLVIK